MDTITHGIGGALIGKGLFADRWGPAATLAATVGSVFPDCDVVMELITRDRMSLLKYHRGITHSMVAMPFFSAAIGAGIWWVGRRRGIRSSLGAVTLAAAAGMASHILLDGLTSFGTRMWEPVTWTRVSWDWLFIIDPILTALLLVPQVAAWVQGEREKASWRALAMWALFSVLTVLTWGAEWSVGAFVPFMVVPVVSALLAAVFFLPLVSGGLFEWPRRLWCQAGLVLALLYIGVCGVAHQRALERVRQFANRQPLAVEKYAAVPLPPSPFGWNGLVRTEQGIYGARFELSGSLDGARHPNFFFLRDAPPNPYVEQAYQLATVKTFLGFARFPMVRYHREGDREVVDFSDFRFFSYDRRRPVHPFTYQVVLSVDGKLIEQGWLQR